MGRASTGAVTTGEVTRIELSYLLRNGYLKKDGFTFGMMTWTNGSSIQVCSSINEDEKYIRVRYSIKDGRNAGIKDYKIYLTSVPSNLGKGEVPYFICPSSGRRARVLYLCYGSSIFKCRQAYSHRIYYQSQQSSKLSFHNDRYWKLEKELKECRGRSRKATYQGRPTRLKKRIASLQAKQDYHEVMRWKTLPQSIQKHLPELFI